MSSLIFLKLCLSVPFQSITCSPTFALKCPAISKTYFLNRALFSSLCCSQQSSMSSLMTVIHLHNWVILRQIETNSNGWIMCFLKRTSDHNFPDQMLVFLTQEVLSWKSGSQSLKSHVEELHTSFTLQYPNKFQTQLDKDVTYRKAQIC